jgi:hypothetical protein
VTRCGRICFGRLKVNLSTVFSGQLVGIRELEDHVCESRLVSVGDQETAAVPLDRVLQSVLGAYNALSGSSHRCDADLLFCTTNGL